MGLADSLLAESFYTRIDREMGANTGDGIARAVANEVHQAMSEIPEEVVKLIDHAVSKVVDYKSENNVALFAQTLANKFPQYQEQIFAKAVQYSWG